LTSYCYLDHTGYYFPGWGTFAGSHLEANRGLVPFLYDPIWLVVFPPRYGSCVRPLALFASLLRRDVRTPGYACIARYELVSTILQRRYDTMLWICRVVSIMRPAPRQLFGRSPSCCRCRSCLRLPSECETNVSVHTMLLPRST
jgi:hypothetical protein